MKASVFVGTSVDGFIARLDDTLDFLPADGGEPHGFDEFMATVDALVMGRNTYDVVLGLGPWPFNDKPVFVLSSREIPPPPDASAGATIECMSGTPVEIVAQLERRGIQSIYVDGGRTIQQFLEAGLIQRLIVTRVPVLIGTGIPLFGPVPKDVKLRHVSTRSFVSGLVQSEYEVIG